jgi:hypothetical protein
MLKKIIVNPLMLGTRYVVALFRNNIPYSGTRFLIQEQHSLFRNNIPCSGTRFLVQEQHKRHDFGF